MKRNGLLRPGLEGTGEAGSLVILEVASIPGIVETMTKPSDETQEKIKREMEANPGMTFGEAVHRALVKPNKDEEGFIRRLIENFGITNYKFIREFCIVDAQHHVDKIGAPCFVFFVPDGHWRPFATSYQETVDMFEETDRNDAQFLEYINGMMR